MMAMIVHERKLKYEKNIFVSLTHDRRGTGV